MISMVERRRTREDELGSDATQFQKILKEIRWAGDHYAFESMGMYIGIETDGYMHT